MLIAVSVYDLRFKKIPNGFSLGILIVGLTVHSGLNAIPGLITSVSGLTTGLACSLLFYYFAGLGAGDVKLFTAIGSVVGYQGVFFTIAYSYVITALLGLLYIKLWLPWYQSKNVIDGSATSLRTQRIPMAPGISLAILYLLYTKPYLLVTP